MSRPPGTLRRGRSRCQAPEPVPGTDCPAQIRPSGATATSARHRTLPPLQHMAQERSGALRLAGARVQLDGGPDQRPERLGIDLVTLADVDGATGIAVETRVE